VLKRFLSRLPTDERLVLVPHSNAGLYVPGLVAQRRVAAAVFVDAVLPIPGSPTPVAPVALLELLRPKVDADGMLPPWTTWWDEPQVAELFPSRTVREQVEGEQKRLPLSYLTGVVPDAPGWEAVPGPYLSFGDTYAAARQAAAQRGWPTATMPGRHLHMLVDPDGVADQILSLLEQVGVTSIRQG